MSFDLPVKCPGHKFLTFDDNFLNDEWHAIFSTGDNGSSIRFFQKVCMGALGRHTGEKEGWPFYRLFKNGGKCLRKCWRRWVEQGWSWKCEFGSGEMTYLGHRIGVEGVAPDPEKVEGIANFPKPSNVRSVRRFPFSCCDVLNCRNFDDFLSKQKLKNSYYSG